MIPTLTASTPFSERRTQTALHLAPRVAVGAIDAYVSGMTAVGMPMVTAMQTTGALGKSVVASAASAAETLPLLNGALAAGHAAAALWCFFSEQGRYETDTLLKARKLMGIGEVITAAGFVGQACGFGVWALPVTAVGLVTASVAHTIRAKSQQ